MQKPTSIKMNIRIPYDLYVEIENYNKDGKKLEFSQKARLLWKKALFPQNQYEEIIKEKHRRIKELEKELEDMVEMVRERRSLKDGQEPKLKCLWKMPDGSCGKFWLSRGKKIDVEDEDCDWCLEFQQFEKTEGAKVLKSAKRTQQRTSNIDINTATIQKKKPKPKILCDVSGRWENPLKIQARCAKCKIGEFREWAKCQKRYIQHQNRQ